MPMIRFETTRQRLVFFVALFLVIFDNTHFFEEVLKVYPPRGMNLLFIASLAVVHLGVVFLVLSLLTYRYTTKLVLTAVLLVSATVAYFTQTYRVIIDDEMIRNVVQTDVREAGDLFDPKFLLYIFFLGIVPSVFVWRTRIRSRSFRREVFSKAISIVIALALVFVPVVSLSKYYTSFFREHKPLRYHTNPSYWIYSLGKYLYTRLHPPMTGLKSVGTDATIPERSVGRVVIMVVGEAARADHFSLNGYARDTNPELSRKMLVNYEKMYSCGTSTAYSVPCMFSVYTRNDFDYEKALHTENVLDVLRHTGKTAILWRDNNSDSKGVALRVRYEDFRTRANNPVCDTECRDIGMLAGLDAFINEHKDKSVLIILHQMGNHGPAYYKRYPESYAHFTPECKDNRLEKCSKESIVNAYDNALRYTDEFLARTIAVAQKVSNRPVAVLYMSDHGESLGEGGVYLHGMPYFIAPDAQKHIGAFLWLNDDFKSLLDMNRIEAKRKRKLSHDYLFHTLLGLFDVKTKVYDKKLDLTR
jgi:lipid A ethanolaminephosphotransferase